MVSKLILLQNKFKLYSFSTINWVYRIVKNTFEKKHSPIHIVFSLVDHYEPGTGGVSQSVEQQRVDNLISNFPQFAQRHLDSSGNCFKMTWFFPPHYHRYGNLYKLVKLCKTGIGEIELHLHHGKTSPDSSHNLEQTLLRCIEEYSQFGIFGKENGNIKFAFIHGDWALNNSRYGSFCGVDNEIDILLKTGCYADFTFPCLNEATPDIYNGIYYAKPQLGKYRVHARGKLVRVGQKNTGLMIIQGPLTPYFIENNLAKFRIINDAIEPYYPITKTRAFLWKKTAIHIPGKPNWIFIKTHTHGGASPNIFTDDRFDKLLFHLERNYNDGQKYALHYTSAREMYNIIKAAEAGKTGNPSDFRDYIIKPPQYRYHNCHEASSDLINLLSNSYKL